MNTIDSHNWTIGASYAEHAETNRNELLAATLCVMRYYGSRLKTVEWFGSKNKARTVAEERAMRIQTQKRQKRAKSDPDAI